MNPNYIAELEAELKVVKRMYDRDEAALATSSEPLVDKIFFNSSKKRRLDLEKELFHAKSERAHELVSLRLMGNQMTGTIRLKSLVKIIEPLNALLEQSAWRFWDKEGKAEKIDDNFSNLLDLRLAGIESGSTQLLVLGNTAPDLTGDSALEEGLKNIFSLLTSGNDEFLDHVHTVGLAACKSLAKLMEILDRQNIAAEFNWSGPGNNYSWHGKPSEITRIRTILDDIGEPALETESFMGVVQLLSIRSKIEIYRPDTEKKIIINYHRSQADEINELRLGDQREFIVEKTVYPFGVTKKKKGIYALKEINRKG